LNHRSARISERRANFSFLKAFASIRERAQEDSQLKDIVVTALKVSVHEALNHPDLQMRDKCSDEISKELMMSWNAMTFQLVYKRTIATPNMIRVYPCHMFSKEKFLANDFNNVDARLVAGGDWVEPGTVGETSPPTVNIMSVVMILNIATVMKYEVSTQDVIRAFLVSELIVGERPMYLWLDRELFTLLVALVPALKSLVDEPTGVVHFQIMRYLYCMPQASFHFYNRMNATLKEMEFTRLLGVPCVYVRGGNTTTRVIVAIYANDLLMGGAKVAKARFQYEIEHEYVLTGHCEKNLSDIGLDIIVSPTNISVHK
jgi:hypothetical protein